MLYARKPKAPAAPPQRRIDGYVAPTGEKEDALICPHCLKTIEDGSSFCPYCNTYVGPGDGPEHTEFVFCDGCGARLSPHDRTCPKCGRPAPGILSSDAAASDLAAGRTAGFPRLTQEQIDTEVPHAPASAAAVLKDAADPNETCVLPAFDKDFGIPKVELPVPGGSKEAPDSEGDTEKKPARKRKVHADEDAYHKHKRHIPKPLIVIVAVAAIAGGIYWFVTEDPIGVMPGFYQQFGQAAQSTFPTRQKGESSDGADAGSSEGKDVVQEQTVLTDDQLYDKLSQIYQTIVSYNDDDKIGDVITSFNSGYLRSSLSARQELSQGAYALRDEIQKTLDEIDGLKYQDGSAYSDDVSHMHQLAEWMYERVDAICKSWDVSLAIPDGESMSQHQSDILAPMVDAGNSALSQFDANVNLWKPAKLS